MKSEGPESNADRPLAVAGAPVILSDPSGDTVPQQNQTVNTSEVAAGGQNTEAGADTAGEAPASAREGGQNTAILYSFHNIPVPTYEQLIEKPDIPVVDIRKPRHGSFKQEREEFLNSERAHRLYSAPVTNRDTGEIIFITPATVRHSFSNIGWEQIELAEHLPEIIESAVLIHAEQSRKAPEDRTKGVYILLGVAKTDNGVQPVKLTVKEYSIKGQRLPKDIESYYGTGSDPTTYADIYDGKVLILESIKKEEPSGSATTDTAKNAAVSYPLGSLDEGPSGSAAAIVPTAQFHPSGPSKISVNDLLSLVKGTAARYIPTSFRYDPPLYLPAPGMTKDAARSGSNRLWSSHSNATPFAEKNVPQQEQTVKPSEVEGAAGGQNTEAGADAAGEAPAAAREGLPQKAKEYIRLGRKTSCRESSARP